MRPSILSTTFLLAACATLSHAGSTGNSTDMGDPREHISGGSQWAYFCTDDNCSENCGEWVDMYNPGCLSGAGSKSIMVKGNSWDYLCLIASADLNCPCQSSSQAAPDGSGRWSVGCNKLPEGGYQSWRWVSGPCPSNNC